ncbi:MAG: glycosyltransferase family 4 protein [Chloroflexi bacterium]|nr:glycosyltransferase family 4 protein [Chloroflexota bacterium]
MLIWLINHYAVPPKYYPLARQTYFAKHLISMGHEVRIIAASTVHNSDLNLITDGAQCQEEIIDGIKYTYIHCHGYQGNGLARMYNMCEFALKLPNVCKQFSAPDVIVSTSMPPFSCAMGIRLAKKYGIKGIAEIADLWPESIVVYGLARKRNPVISMLYKLEKWIYKKADAIIFTMEGGRDYIIEKGWDKAHGGPIDLRKVYHINNGVDLESFHQNLYENAYHDKDLDDEASFKVVYTGSVRRANNIDLVIDAAKLLHDTRVSFLIYGDGTELERLKQRCKDEQVNNVVFKNVVEKKHIPSILSRSDLNFFVLEDSNLFRFGLSLNKSFEYLASGKPLLIIGRAAYSMVDKYKCGLHVQATDAREFADAVMRIKDQSRDAYLTMCDNARKAANDYDFKVLAKNLIKVIEKTAEDKQAVDEGVK